MAGNLAQLLSLVATASLVSQHLGGQALPGAGLASYAFLLSGIWVPQVLTSFPSLQCLQRLCFLMFIQLFCLFSVGESVYHKICHSLKQKCPTRLYVKRFFSSTWISKLELPYMSQSTVSSVCVPLSLIDSSSLGEVEKPESPNLQSCGPALESVSTPRTNPSGNAAWVTSQHPHPPPPPANTQSTPLHHFLAAVSSLRPQQTPQ